MRIFAVSLGLLMIFSAQAQMGYYNQNSYGNNSFGGSGYGTPSYGYGNDRYQQPPTATQEPEALVHEGINKLQAFMRGSHGGDQGDSLRFVEHAIAPYFDFDYMAKWAAGPRWRYLSPMQKNEMSGTIRKLFLAALARNVAGYNTPKVTVHRARKGRSSGELNVPVTISPRYGRGVRVQMTFRFYRSGEGWKVFDVTANNTSAVMYYRRYFSQQSAGYSRY